MSTGQGLFCMALSTAALLGGAALSIASAPAGVVVFSTGALAGTTLSAIGGSIAGNVTHSGLKQSFAAVSKRLTAANRSVRLPQNHDLIRALRRSQLDAIRFLSDSFREEVRQAPFEYVSTEAEKLYSIIDAYVVAELKKTERRDFPPDMGWFETLEDERKDIEQNLPKAEDGSAASTMAWLALKASEAGLSEIRDALAQKGVSPSTAFLDWYEGRFGPGGFSYAAQQFFAERMKTDERLRTAVFSASLRAIEQQGAAALELLSKLDRNLKGIEDTLSARFDALEAQIKALAPSKQLLDFEGYVERLLEASAARLNPAALRDIVRSALPHDNWIASTASHDVSRRIESLLYRQHADNGPLMPAFFGRDDQLALLHSWIDESEKGLAVLCAQSGGGKSALLAKLIQERRRGGDIVVRHFVSLQMPSTTRPDSVLAHLLGQIRVIDQSDPKIAEMQIPSEESRLIDALHSRLKEPPPEGRRMIIVIDGLDEMDAAFGDTFVRSDMAPGYFVIVSHRAKPDVKPPDLRRWLAAESAPGERALRFDLPGMRAQDLMPWLEERIGDLSDSDMKTVCARLEKVTDGVPLFLRFLIEILIEDFQKLPDRDSRLKLIANLSSPFAGFLKVYLDGEPESFDAEVKTQTGRDGFSMAEKNFLALLTQTLGAISEKDLASALTFHMSGTQQQGSINVSRLDRMISRWLSILPAEPDSPDTTPRISFDHPQLAIEFAKALSPYLTEPALSSLIGWGQSSWAPTVDGVLRRTIRGAEYPVWRLPEHFLALGQIDEAAEILMDTRFIEERFWSFESRKAAALMVRDWTVWKRKSSELKLRARNG